MDMGMGLSGGLCAVEMKEGSWLEKMKHDRPASFLTQFQAALMITLNWPDRVKLSLL